MNGATMNGAQPHSVESRHPHEWSQRQERSSLFWLRMAGWIYRKLGKRLCRWPLYPVSLYFFATSPATRRASSQFLRRVLPERYQGWPGRFRLLIDCYRNVTEFSLALLDKFAVWIGDISMKEVSFDGKQELRALLDSRKGAVVMSAHLGNIEVLRAMAQDELNNVRVNALMFTEHNPGFNAFLRSANPAAHLRIIPSESPGPELIVDLESRIQNGEIVAMLGDRIMPGSPDKFVHVDFLGSPARFPIGPFLIASLLRCPVFLVFCFRDGDGYRTYFEKFADIIELPRKSRDASISRYVQNYARRLEHFCRSYRLQWFNFYDFWNS